MDNNVGIDCGRDRLDGSEQKGKNSDNYNSINNKINLKKKKRKNSNKEYTINWSGSNYDMLLPIYMKF